MRYTINLISNDTTALCIEAKAGRVMFNGVSLMPYEAVMLAEAFAECAGHADKLAADTAAAYIQKYKAKAAA